MDALDYVLVSLPPLAIALVSLLTAHWERLAILKADADSKRQAQQAADDRRRLAWAHGCGPLAGLPMAREVRPTAPPYRLAPTLRLRRPDAS